MLYVACSKSCVHDVCSQLFVFFFQNLLRSVEDGLEETGEEEMKRAP